MHMKKLEDEESQIDEHMVEVQKLIQEKEQSNIELANKVRENKKMLKEHEEKK